MKRQCWICKCTDEKFLKQRENILQQIDQEIKSCDEFEKNIVNETAQKLGFTSESKEKVKKLTCLDVTVSAILDNESYFLKADSNLQILLDYNKKYGYSRKFRTVKELVDTYCKEPMEQRYNNEVQLNRNKRTKLLQKKEQIEQLKTSFILYNVEPKFYSSTKVAETKPTILRSYNRYEIPSRPHPDISYSSLGFDFEKEIYLCPICSTLFLQAADAVYETRASQLRAAQQAEMDDDDWEDDF